MLFLELLILGCACKPLNFNFGQPWPLIRFCASFSAALSLRISSLVLPGFGWGGKGNNVRDSVCSPFHTLPCQEGLEAARGAILTLFPASAPLLRCHFGEGEGAGRRLWRCRVTFLELQHQHSLSDTLKPRQVLPEGFYEEYFLRCLFLKYLSKKGRECSY